MFDINGDATVTFSGLTITGGSANVGGGVLVETGSTLDITQCTLTDNEALGDVSGNAFGGAIMNEVGASLSIVQTLLASNQTDGGNQSYGGAVYNQGSATILSSTFTANQALGSLTSFSTLGGPPGGPIVYLPGGSLGGAIMNDDGATMIVSQSDFAHNAAESGSGGDALGGAIDNESASASLGVTVSVMNSTFSGNQAIAGLNLGNGYQGAFGGAIEDLAGTTITVIRSAFAKNQAIAMAPTTADGSSYVDGGAIDNGASAFTSPLNVNLTVVGSSFSGNVASGDPDLAPGFANFAYGGAVNWNLFGVLGGSLSFSDSSFVGNQAIAEPATDGEFGAGVGGVGQGGAIYAGSALSLTSCTLIGNQAIGGSADGRAGYGEGGAIDAYGDLTATGCILIGNAAIGGSGGSNPGGRGIFSGYADGGGINLAGVSNAITNSILIGNQAIGGSSSVGVGGFAIGGGIASTYATLTLQGSTLTGNAARGGQGGPGGQGGGAGGGGIDIESSSIVDLIGSTLIGNSANGGAAGSGGSGGVALGGGISLSLLGLLYPPFNPDGSALSLSACLLSGNQSNGGAGASGGNGGNALGGGIGVNGEDTAAVSGSVLDSNSATGGSGFGGGNGGNGFGGGLYVDIGSSAGVTGSTITRNQAIGGYGVGRGSEGQGIGGGVYYLGTFTADTATVIRKNHASTSNNDIFPS